MEERRMTRVSPLRRKMNDAMTMKGLSETTQEHYLREVARFDCHTGHRLEVQTQEAIRALGPEAD